MTSAAFLSKKATEKPEIFSFFLRLLSLKTLLFLIPEIESEFPDDFVREEMEEVLDLRVVFVLE